MDYQSLLQQITLYMSPIEIAVRGRSINGSQIEVIIQGQITHSLSTKVHQRNKFPNTLYPPVTHCTPPHGSIKPRDTGIYHGMHRNYTPRPRRKHIPVTIVNVNRNYMGSGEYNITKRQLSYMKPPKMR